MSKVSTKKIAITGGIGSGKSQVIKILKSRGYNCFSSDEYVSYLLKKGNEGYLKIIKNFDNILNDDGEINKSKLANIIFNDKAELEKINNLLHPLVIEKIIELSKLEKILIAEIPLLFEANLSSYFDVIISVVSDLDIRVDRLIKRGMEKNDIYKRILNQTDDEFKIKNSDYVIYNNFSEDFLEIEVDKIIKEVIYE